MADHDDHELRLWVETWARAGPKLEAIRRRELREMTHEERVRVIDAVLQIGARFSQPRTSSGLVEQQRLFQKLRR